MGYQNPASNSTSSKDFPKQTRKNVFPIRQGPEDGKTTTNKTLFVFLQKIPEIRLKMFPQMKNREMSTTILGKYQETAGSEK